MFENFATFRSLCQFLRSAVRSKFIESTDVNSLAITKLDGTAKGGVILGISDQFQIPVKYIGVGEGMDDLQEFDSQNFMVPKEVAQVLKLWRWGRGREALLGT